MTQTRLPAVIPAGWNTVRLGDEMLISRDRPDGLKALFSIENLTDRDPSEAGGPGVYRHLSISRKKRYPGWDEMRDFVYGCGLFDPSRDVVMYLPPPAQYVNRHEFCFHFYQKEQR